MDGLHRKAFSKGNLGLGLMGSGLNEDEWMTKGRSHGRLFLVFKWLFGVRTHLVRVASRVGGTVFVWVKCPWVEGFRCARFQLVWAVIRMPF